MRGDEKRVRDLHRARHDGRLVMWFSFGGKKSYCSKKMDRFRGVEQKNIKILKL